MHRLLIIGAGGHGVVVADAAELSKEWSRISFIDDAHPKTKKVAHWDVVGSCTSLPQLADVADAAIVAIGDPETRLKLIAAVKQAGIPLVSVYHPRASVSGLAEIGNGTVLMANAVVNARAKVGAGCIINTAATVDHDCCIADGVHIAPGAHLAADVRVGEKTWIGAGATVRGQIRVGSGVVVGVGAAVVNDVPDGLVVVGVPARPIRSLARVRGTQVPSA